MNVRFVAIGLFGIALDLIVGMTTLALVAASEYAERRAAQRKS